MHVILVRNSVTLQNKNSLQVLQQMICWQFIYIVTYANWSAHAYHEMADIIRSYYCSLFFFPHRKYHLIAIRCHFCNPNTMRQWNQWNRNNSLLMSSTWSIEARWHWFICNLMNAKKNCYAESIRIYTPLKHFTCCHVLKLNWLRKWIEEFNKTWAITL